MILDEISAYQRAIDEQKLPLHEGGPQILDRLRQAVDLLPPDSSFLDDMKLWIMQNWAEVLRSGDGEACESWWLFLIDVDSIIGN